MRMVEVAPGEDGQRGSLRFNGVAVVSC